MQLRLLIGLSLILVSELWMEQTHAQTKKGPSVPYLIEWTIKKSPLKSEIAQKVIQRRWKEAIAVCERNIEQTFSDVTIIDGSTATEEFSDEDYSDEWNWRATVGELYLYDLKPGVAIKKFDYIRRVAPKKRMRGFTIPFTSNARRRAAAGLAQAYAQSGMFPQALNWLRQSNREEWDGCGTCGESIRIETSAISQVWKTANQPVGKAISELQQLVEGKYKPLKVNLRSQVVSNKYQKQLAAREAALIMGQIYMRQGQREKAHTTFKLLLQHPDSADQTYIANTYLDRI